jgi:hypothetical protein
MCTVTANPGHSIRPFHDKPAADEMKPGPGLISGEDGKFVLYGTSLFRGSVTGADDQRWSAALF